MASADGDDVRIREIGRPGPDPVEHRADLAGEQEIGVDNGHRRTLTAGRAVARERRLDPAGPARSPARLGTHDCGHQHVATTVQRLAQERAERVRAAVYLGFLAYF